MNALVFVEYTKRFDQIMCSFPPGAWQARTKPATELPAPTSELRNAYLRYLNLCAEEFFLLSQNYLSVRVWLIWEAELQRTLRSALFAREWAELRAEFDAHPPFQAYVEAVMAGSHSALKGGWAARAVRYLKG